MNRRGFLKRGAMAVLGAAVAVALPGLVKANPVAPALAPVGVPAYVEDECFYWGGRRFIIDLNCPPDTIYFINLSAVKRDGINGDTFYVSPESRFRLGKIDF